MVGAVSTNHRWASRLERKGSIAGSMSADESGRTRIFTSFPRRSGTHVLAVASGGGHWDELMLLRPALDKHRTTYVTTNRGLAVRDGVGDAIIMIDSNRDQPRQAIKCLIAAFRIVWNERPDVLITTGALPGLFCLIFARLLGSRTVWIDSIANSDAPSLSGTIARPFASLWLTQWKHLADGKSKLYCGELW